MWGDSCNPCTRSFIRRTEEDKKKNERRKEEEQKYRKRKDVKRNNNIFHVKLPVRSSQQFFKKERHEL